MIADIPFKNMAMGEKNVVVTVLVFCLFFPEYFVVTNC